METQTHEQLSAQHCRPCERGTAPLSPAEAERRLASLSEWQMSSDARRISKCWTARDFTAAIEFFHRVATLAEQEGHHPDLHLENYRHTRIELSTHAIRGLSENDFILAAKIDTLPFETKE